ncbi:MAG: FGGY family carbohydrate kinase [Deinococcales bacterium]
MLLGIDIGTTHSKAAIFDRSGKLLASDKTLTPKSPDGAHYLADRLWQEVARLIAKVKEASTVKIAALAVSSMGETGVGLDESGNLTLPVIPWYDQRAHLEMMELREGLGKEKLFNTTGLYANPIHSIAKWMYLQKHHPYAWQKTRTWLSMCDFINYKLTDKSFICDSQAARTMAYDVNKGRWSIEILKAAGLKANFLPPVVPAARLIGEVSHAASKLTGLSEGTPVFSGGHDHLCACFACGVIDPSTVLDSIGTAESLNTALTGKLSSQEAKGFGFGPHVVKDQMYLMGGIYSSGGAKAWVKELFKLASFQELEKMAAQVTPGASPLFIAHFHGAAPPWNKESQGAFIDLTTKHGPAEMIRAVYEGIGFEFRRGLEALEVVTGKTIERLFVVGLSAEDRLSGPLRASIYQKPLEIPRYDDMVTFGAALLAGVGANIYDSHASAVAKTHQLRGIIQPEDVWQESYAKIFPHYKTAALALLIIGLEKQA